jgi:hypothetical protein
MPLARSERRLTAIGESVDTLPADVDAIPEILLLLPHGTESADCAERSVRVHHNILNHRAAPVRKRFFAT